MKLKQINFSLIILLILLMLNTNAYSKTKWLSFNEGIKLADKQNKPILVDFYASWCHWCEKMDKEVFENKSVAKNLQRDFVTIRIDTESNTSLTYKGKTFSPKQFSQAVGVTGLPTLLFMEKDGTPITKLPGFVKADMFKSILAYIKKKCYKTKISFHDFIKNKESCN